MNYRAIRDGIPAAAVKSLVRNGTLTEAELYRIIPERTFKRRLQQKAKLKIDEADAIARLLRVTEEAERSFGGADFARKWLRLPNPALGGEVPIELARTDAGAREVEAVMSSFAFGDHL
ncbi:MAG: antitoxin Xre/MbcA/ParS toxin-binding domain-containing protein [Hyphomicrobiales bacterium]